MLNLTDFASKGDKVLPMSSDDSSRLDLPVEMKLFRVKHYVAVYNLALEVTGTPGAAKELTERVFDNAARRFENRTIPLNCDKYLAAQVYLLYAQKNLPTLSSVTASAMSSESLTADHEGKPSSTEVTPKSTPDTIKSSPTKEVSEPVLIAESGAMPRDAFSGAGLKSTAAGTSSATAKTLDTHNEPAIGEAVYDKKRTEFWTPGLETKSIPIKDVAQNKAPEPEGQGDKPSVAISILNAFLVVASLASIFFLLLELIVLPRFN